MSDRVQTAGGSVANTIAGVGSLGLSTAFLGKVKDDALGRFYARGMAEQGTAFPEPSGRGRPAANLAVDDLRLAGRGTLDEHLPRRRCADFDEDDVDATVASRAQWLFLEGYLYDKPEGKAAFTAAARHCRQGGGKVGITLSDPFCVDRHRDDFLRLIAEEMDYTIGNHEEWLSLYQTEDLEAALAEAAKVCDLVVCTHSGDPVKLIRGDERAEVPVDRITPVDATGAGDQFAAGFLYGMATGQDLETAGRMGVAAASEVIRHVGPRPKRPLKALFLERGLI
jgi:sugar/nucleoside kinase (ribokinase family)